MNTNIDILHRWRELAVEAARGAPGQSHGCVQRDVRTVIVSTAAPLNVSISWSEAPAHVSDNDTLTAFEADCVAKLRQACPFDVARSPRVAVAYNH